MSKKTWRAPVLAGLVLLGAALPALAAPVTWNLKNVTFDDGATASGWIAFDAEAPASSLYSISVTAGPELSAFSYTESTSDLYTIGAYGPNSFFLWEVSGAAILNRTFNFAFDAPLTDAGGTRTLLTDYSYDCTNCAPYRMVASGSLTTLVDGPIPNGVPEPATLGLMLPALGMLGAMARRRKQKAA